MEKNDLEKTYNIFGKIIFYFSFTFTVLNIIGDYYDFSKFLIFDEKINFSPSTTESRLRWIILNVLTIKFVIKYKYDMIYIKQISFLIGITLHFIYNFTYWLTMDYSNISRGEIIYNNLPWIWFIMIWLMLSILNFKISLPKKSELEILDEENKSRISEMNYEKEFNEK